MLSFKVITEENKEEITRTLCEGLSASAVLELRDIIDSFEPEEDVELAFSVYAKCALVRVFDMGRYSFLFPLELCEGASVTEALGAISKYAAREELGLRFVGVPAESLSSFAGFRHFDIDADDPCGESYRIRIKTECELITEIPDVEEGRVKLNALKEADIPAYARLCRDENVNKYWGYDYRDDVSSPEDAYFYEAAANELSRGVALAMAIRKGCEFIGELTLYSFDAKGGAELAVRLLPEYWGRGLGSEAILAAKAAAREIGLTVLYTDVMNENLRSIRMLDGIGELVKRGGNKSTYKINIYDFS